MAVKKRLHQPRLSTTYLQFQDSWPCDRYTAPVSGGVVPPQSMHDVYRLASARPPGFLAAPLNAEAGNVKYCSFLNLTPAQTN